MVAADRSMDYRNIDAATAAVRRGLRRGALVCYETTLPVGTTRRRLGPMLEKESGLAVGRDFHLAFSPERLYAGRIFEDLRKYPKIVGGVDEASTRKAVEFYRSVLDAEVWAVENTETAEFAKLAETTYRDVNIALANQLALYAASRDVNVNEAFKAANSQPYSHIHRPGLGVGGHCIPVYPHFLLGDAANGLLRPKKPMKKRRWRRSLNGNPIQLWFDHFKLSARTQMRRSTIRTASNLVSVHLLDPHFQRNELRSLEAEVIEDVDTAMSQAFDAVVVQAWHSEFRELDWRRFRGLKVVLDGRGMLDAASVRRAGATYIAIGISETRAGVPK